MNKHDSGVALNSLAIVGYDGSRAAQYLVPLHLVFQSNWVFMEGLKSVFIVHFS